jgi:hypothetical protein
MEFISKIKELIDSAKMYAELKLRELRLEAAEKVSAAVADVTAAITLFLFGIMFIFFISVWGALLLNHILASAHLGFLIVGFVWLIAGLIIFAIRKSLIKRPLRNRIIEKVMRSSESSED